MIPKAEHCHPALQGVCDTLASIMAIYVCTSVHSSEQSDHSHHTVIDMLNICLLPSRRASTLFYRVRDAPVCSNVKNTICSGAQLHSIFTGEQLLVYSNLIRTLVPGQNHIVSIYFSYILFRTHCWLELFVFAEVFYLAFLCLLMHC